MSDTEGETTEREERESKQGTHRITSVTVNLAPDIQVCAGTTAEIQRKKVQIPRTARGSGKQDRDELRQAPLSVSSWQVIRSNHYTYKHNRRTGVFATRLCPDKLSVLVVARLR